MAKRAAGSDRGRSSIDWGAAFHYFASLPDPERSYRAVADTFDVSVRTVETHGRREHWKERLSRIQADAAEAADQQITESRAQKLAELELLIDASMTSYAQQLRAGSVKVVPGDLLRLFKLREELWTQEAVQRGAQSARDVASEDPQDTQQRKRELVAALEEAGAFERLRNLTSPPYDIDDDVGDAEAA